MVVDVIEGHRIWSSQYDTSPNPLLALETRVLGALLGEVAGRRILDAGCGTGRWMQWARQRNAIVVGIDACQEMIAEAARKPGLAGRSALADIRNLPIRDHAIDIAICSFTLGYLPSVSAAIRELARVARFLILSDVHPAALQSGWKRSFRAHGELCELTHYQHSPGHPENNPEALGLTPVWRVEAAFDEPERAIFQAAGKEDIFETVRRVPAVLITAWTGISN